jgi:NHLM bacteriocin system ABC transporter ATP-binding protein
MSAPTLNELVRTAASPPLVLGANAPIALDDPAVAWMLLDGQADIHAVRIGDVPDAGMRRSVYTARAGDVLPGCAAASGLALLVAGTSATRVVRLDAAAVFAAPDAAAPLARFLRGLRSALPPEPAALARGEVLAKEWNRAIKGFFEEFDTEWRLADVDAHDTMRTQQEAMDRALAEGFRNLGAVYGEPAEDAAPHTAPLVTACSRVARACGIDVQESAVSDGRTVGNIADAWGIRYRTVTLRADWWCQDGGPLLGFLCDDSGAVADVRQPVALVPHASGSYMAHDPVHGTSFRVDAATAQRIAPVAYCFYAPFANRALRFMDVIRHTAFGLKPEFAYLGGCGLALALLAVVPPIGIKLIFTDIIPGSNRVLLLQVVLMLGVVAAAVFIFSLIRTVALVRVAVRMDFRLDTASWDRLIRLPAAVLRRESAGEWSDRVEGLRLIRIRLFDSFIVTLLSGIFAISNVVMLFVFGRALAWPALGLLLVGALAGTYFNVRQASSWREYFALRGRLTGKVVQFFSGIAKIRLAGSEDRVFGLWADEFASQQKRMLRAGSQQNRLLVFNLIFPVAAMMVLFRLAAQSVQMMEPGVFLGFLASYVALQTALLAITGAAAQLSSVIPLYRRMQPVFSQEPENSGGGIAVDTLRGAVDVAHLQFRYAPGDPPVLVDVDLSVRPGEFLALVGPSGCGKSTLLRLLLGLEKPSAGAIYYDDHNLADLDLRTLRRHRLGVVMQNAGLLPGDILSNIIGMRALTEDDAWEALRQVGLDAHVRQLPLGLRTPIGAGRDIFSGGEKQRLVIARALASRPAVLLLDEATSALDNRSQDIVTRSLEALPITRIVVAHRLSTVRNADRIVLLEGGRIIESGTYAELFAQKGRFHDLVKRQTIPV